MDPTLMEARLELLAADHEGAAGMYAAWLDGSSDSPEAPVVFDRYFAEEQKLAPLLDTARKFLRSARKGIHLPSTVARIARLFEVAGRTEEARDAYLTAFAGDGPVSSLESAFLLSLEMNDVEALRSALAAAKNAAGDRIDFLRACLALQTGDDGPANGALARIAETSADQSTVLRALWMSYQMAVHSGDSSARQEAARRIQARFPRSPECAIVSSDEEASVSPASANVTLLAFPSSFFSGQPGVSLPATGESATAEPTRKPAAGQPATAEPATVQSVTTQPAAISPAPATPQPATDSGGQSATAPPQRTVSVQVGSFQMKENADDLVGELTRHGFSPSLRTDSQQGKALYRVFAGSRLSVDEARRLLDSLHQAGFSGFLLNDQ